MTEQLSDQFTQAAGEGSRDPRIPIPTPWALFTEMADLTFRHKVGVIGMDGTEQANMGHQIALHAATQGIRTLLYTQRQLPAVPGDLIIDNRPTPTPEQVRERSQALRGGKKAQFIVIEDFGRLQPEERSDRDRYDPIDDLDYVPLSEAEELLWSVRELRLDVPLLLTTTISVRPDLSRPLDRWIGTDHPAYVLTEVCKPVIVLQRTTEQTVELRMEVNPSAFYSGQRMSFYWPSPSLEKSVPHDTSMKPESISHQGQCGVRQTHGGPIKQPEENGSVQGYAPGTLWGFSSKNGYFQKHELALYAEPSGSTITDDYSPDDISAQDLWKMWVDEWANYYHLRWPELYRPGEIHISWFITTPQMTDIFERAPHSADPRDLPGEPYALSSDENFLTYYTHPTREGTREKLNWLRLPVIDRGWNDSASDKGGFIQEATGWKPAPLQRTVDVRQLAAAAGLYCPEVSS